MISLLQKYKALKKKKKEKIKKSNLIKTILPFVTSPPILFYLF